MTKKKITRQRMAELMNTSRAQVDRSIPSGGENDVFGLFYQTNTHARLGNESAALAYRARLPDDFWTPGVEGAPAGGKAEIANKLRRMAADARRRRV